MKQESLAALLSLLLATTTESFTIPSATPSSYQQSRLFSSNDAAFSAFADSLDTETKQGQQADNTATLLAPKEDRSWQTKLDDVLNPLTTAADRQVLISDLFNSNQAIRDSVVDAVSKRQIDPLLTPNGRKLQDGTRAVARQITNDILPGIQQIAPPAGRVPQPPSLNKVGTRLFEVFSNQVQRNIEYLQEDLKDPFNKIPKRISEQTETLAQEAKNVFLETPEGLEEPEYTVVGTQGSYEIRDYSGYSVAETAMGKLDDVASAGKAFNSLAAYIFGANEDQQSMPMTTPVTTTSAGEMRFYLSENKIPEPLDKSTAPIDSESGSIRIVEIPAARLAVRKFTGFVTDGEIARQKESLMQSLELDGVELDVPHGAVVPHVIFQYNPPYTLPIVRRNEIAVPVRGKVDDIENVTDIREQWDIATNGEVDEAAVTEAVTSSQKAGASQTSGTDSDKQ